MKRLWMMFGLVMFVSSLILGWIGTRIYQEAPPIAMQVVTPDGRVIIDENEIGAGQNVWQSLGGMEVVPLCLVVFVAGLKTGNSFRKTN